MCQLDIFFCRSTSLYSICVLQSSMDRTNPGNIYAWITTHTCTHAQISAGFVKASSRFSEVLEGSAEFFKVPQNIHIVQYNLTIWRSALSSSGGLFFIKNEDNSERIGILGSCIATALKDVSWGSLCAPAPGAQCLPTRNSVSWQIYHSLVSTPMLKLPCKSFSNHLIISHSFKN